ncbi:sugar ABC transporter permease [Bacillus sp. 31A1R]|uniref:Sugar ABC transporter permease n=1 Tax=Robertmurraya mangrovi TaxID=3098077 RepID=A0ABU5J1L8_9BACI|nr:sugar ABC transporter permease [Bacillus sp. 31A1R]MDZ5473289.1 sugar ABC transporter permease [Bacillus sp. 31A1R]
MKTNVQAWLLFLPSLIFLLMFTFYPVLQTIYLSFFRADLAIPDPFFVGLENYQQLKEDAVFWKVMKNTFWFVFTTVPISMILALAMALFVNRAIRGTGWLKTAFFYPTVIPMIAVANIWLFIYTPGYGMMSQILDVFGFQDINWLGTANTVLPAMIIMAIWKEAGFFMVFYLAGLQSISKELYESASIDGASSWYTLRKITLPLLMPTTLFVSIIAVINTIKLVDHIAIMTKGGPDNASNLLLYYIYETAFNFWNEGMAATLTVVMLVILLIVAIIQIFFVDKKIHYS